jgi:RNA polymerase sigma factor (sigma-70 family)
MRTIGDWELLQDYVQTRSEAAFAELVRRHIDWVYSVAVRRVYEPQLAEDVVQAVFALLARKASSLRPGTTLAGWLFRSTCFVGKCCLRAERRRKNREQTASAMMTTGEDDHPEPRWEQLEPHLDQAVAALNTADRSAVLLRFYQKKSFSEVGRQLGISEEAAKKRVSRTVDRLRGILTRRGASLGVAALAGLLVEKAVQAAPIHLSASVVKASQVGSSAALPQLAHDTLNAWRWVTLRQSFLVGVSAVVLVLFWNGFGGSKLVQQNGWQLRRTQLSVAASRSSNSAVAATEMNLNALSDAPKFLFRAIAADTGKGIQVAWVPVSYVADGEWTRREDLVTDTNGFCGVPLPRGKLSRLDVGVLQDGFVEKFYTWRDDSGVPLPLVYVLRLERAVAVGGHVQDSSGLAISNAQVGFSFYGTGDATFREPAAERLGFVGEPVTASKTDAQGNWRCALTPPGYTDFSIVVQHPSYVERTFAAQTTTESVTGGVRMNDLLNGKSVMILDPGFQLRGFVLDDAGNPLSGARVSSMNNLNFRQDGEKTEANGAFCINSLARGTAQISAWAKGFAPALQSVQVTANSREVVFRLNRGNRVPIRITDQDGTGIPGAGATVDLPISHNAQFNVTTDPKGRAVFEGIPTNALGGLFCHIGAKGYFYLRDVKLDPGQGESRIQLIKSLHVSGTVVDADTGEAVMDFKAIPCRGEDSSGYDLSETKHGLVGAYTVDFSEPGPPFRVRVEAEGYEPAMSPCMADYPSQQEQNFQLRRKSKGRAICGRVLLPGGQPAANTQVALLTFEQGATLYHGTFKRNDGSILTTTDAQGEFKFDPDPQAHTLVAADPSNGFGLLRLHTSTQPFEVQLQPWGRLEGRVMLSGRPAPHEQVFINFELPAYRSVRDGLYAASDFTTTDADGHFGCELVRPGDVTLFLSQGSGRPLSHQTVAEVHCGETSQVQIGGDGRLVTGKFVMSDGRKVDWTTQLMIGSLATNLKTPATQPPPDSHDFAARVKLLEFFDQSKEWRAYERAAGSFPLQVAADGSFTADSIPPGAYRLTARIADSSDGGDITGDVFRRMRRKILASFTEDVLVPGPPDDSTAVDLGTFRVTPKSLGP